MQQQRPNVLKIHAFNFGSAIIHSAVQPDSRCNNLLHFIWDFEWCLESHRCHL